MKNSNETIGNRTPNLFLTPSYLKKTSFFCLCSLDLNHVWLKSCARLIVTEGTRIWLTLLISDSSVTIFAIRRQLKALTYLLTYSMVQSPSWAANWFAASQEIPRISRNPKVHYRTHKRPPPLFILGQPNPVHIPTSHLLQIHPNIIHPSTPSRPQCSLSLRFPHQDPIHPPLLRHSH